MGSICRQRCCRRGGWRAAICESDVVWLIDTTVRFARTLGDFGGVGALHDAGNIMVSWPEMRRSRRDASPWHIHMAATTAFVSPHHEGPIESAVIPMVHGLSLATAHHRGHS